MTDDIESSIKGRLSRLKQRVDLLEEKGRDVDRIKDTLEKLKGIPIAKNVDKLDAPLTKLELIIDKMEKEGEKEAVKARGKRVTKRKGRGGPDEAVKDEKVKETGPEVEKDEMGSEEEKEKKKDKEEEKEGTDGTPDVGGQPDIKEAEEKVEKGQKEDVGPSPEEKADMEQRYRSLKDDLEVAVSMDGDVTPVREHVRKMEEAMEAGDRRTFEGYYKPMEKWVSNYLMELRKNRVTALLSRCEDLISYLAEMNREDDRAFELKRLREVREAVEGKDPPLEELLKAAEEVNRGLEEDLEKGKQDSREKVKEIMEEMGQKIKKLSEDGKFDELMTEYNALREADDADVLQIEKRARSLRHRVNSEYNSIGMKHLERLLLSLEPIINRVGTLEGKDSPRYEELLREKEEILASAEVDIDSAQSGVDQLLDKAARVASQVEEACYSNLTERIKKETAKLAPLEKSGVDVSPITRMLDKARELLDEGPMEEAMDVLNRAVSGIERLRERTRREEGEARIREIDDELKGLKERMVDISPALESLNEASQHLKKGEFTEMEAALSKTTERIGYLRAEELKVDYQKLLIPIMNEMRALSEDGFDISRYQEDFDEIKVLYSQRNFIEAVSKAEKLKTDLISIRISDILKESITLITETLLEAEGLDIPVGPYQESIDRALEMINEGDTENALELVTSTQVEVDEKLNSRAFALLERQVLGLSADAKGYDLDVSDVGEVIEQARKMVSGDRYDQAMERLAAIKVDLTDRITKKVAEKGLDELSKRIREARSIGLEISEYKTALTKAKVRLEAGDVEVSSNELNRNLEEITSRIKERKALMEVLDRLRGSLLAQEGKISRLVSSGVPAGDLSQRLGRIRELIDSMQVERAEEELKELNLAISEIVRSASSRGLKMQTPPPPKKPPVGGEPQALPPAHLDTVEPTEARKKLFELIPNLKKEMAKKRSMGTGDDYKHELEKIMGLVANRDYVDAYKLTLDTYRKIRME